MPKELEYLNAYILGGKEIYNDPDNRSYPRSSFKRIIKGWESALYKIMETDASITRNNEKHNKETHEKEITKFEEQDKKLKKKREQLLDKLNQKMKKEADEYLKNKKDYLNENKISVTKDPKHSPALLDYKEKINNVNDCFLKAYDAVNKKVWPICTNAYKHYKNLVKSYNLSDINFTVDKIKKANIKSIDDIINAMTKSHESIALGDGTIAFPDKSFADEFTKNPGFLHFVFCYATLNNCKEKKFTDWFEKEHSYLKKFSILTEKEMLAYQKHGAFLDNIDLIDDEFNTLKEDLTTLCNYCELIKPTNKLKHIRNKLLGHLYISLAILLSGTLLRFIFSPHLLNLGLKLYNNKNISLYKSITTIVNDINKKIDALVDYTPNKNDLNVRKVEYMRKISKELKQE